MEAQNVAPSLQYWVDVDGKTCDDCTKFNVKRPLLHNGHVNGLGKRVCSAGGNATSAQSCIRPSEFNQRQAE